MSRIFAAMLTLSAAAVAFGQAAPARQAPAATAPATLPGIDASKTMEFKFVNARISDILNELANRFGFIIVQPATPVPGFITINEPNPVHADEAVSLLENVLVPMGYSVVQTYTAPLPSAQNTQHTILRVVTLAEKKKSSIPVFEDNTAGDIPVTDNIATYVIPLKNVDAVTLRNDLTPLLSADADVTANRGSNSLIVTDTQAKIHRLVDIIAKLDHQAPENMMLTVHLKNSNAADTAALINSVFNNPNLAAPAPGAAANPAGGTRGGGRGNAGGRGGGAFGN